MTAFDSNLKPQPFLKPYHSTIRQYKVPTDTNKANIAEEAVMYYLADNAKAGFKSMVSRLTPQDIVTIMQGRVRV